MASPDPYPAGNFAPVTDELTVTGLPVEGALPPELDGQYLRLGPNPARRSTERATGRETDAMVHAVELRDGHALSYRNRWILTPHAAGVLGLGPAVEEIDGCERLVRVDRRVLAVSRSGATYEVGVDLSTWRSPSSPGVLRSDGCLIDRGPSHAFHRLAVATAGRAVRTLVPGLTLGLERHDVVTGRRTVEEVDPTPQGWLVGGGFDERGVRDAYGISFDGDRPFTQSVVHGHDLVRGRRTTFDFGPGRHPGELTFVPDGRRAGEGGWLLGLVHDDRRGADDLVVLRARHLDAGPVATVALPRRVPYGWHGLWRPR